MSTTFENLSSATGRPAKHVATYPTTPNKQVKDITPGSTRRNLRLCMFDGVGFGAMVGLGETYLPAFALALGMSESSAGLVSSLPMIAGGLMQLMSLHFIKLFGSEKRWVVFSATMQAISFIPMLVAAMYGSLSLPVLILFATIYWASGLAAGPAWNTWMEDVVPSGVRAKFFARRARLQQGATLIALLSSGFLLKSAEAQGWLLNGFACLFCLAAMARSISVAFLAAHRENRQLVQRNANRFRQNLDGIPKHKSHQTGRQLLVYLVAVQACVQISGPFFAPYMLRQLEFDYFMFVFLLSVSFVARVFCVTQWTKVARWFGAPTLLWVGSIGLVPLSALWIVSDSLVWLTIAQVCSGVAWAAYELGFFLLFFETLPPRDRTRMLTYYNFAHTAAIFTGATIGATLFNILGCNQQAYFVLFAISTIGRAAALLLLARTKLRPVPIRSIALRIFGIRANGSLDVPVVAAINATAEKSA
jgi:MFS family permease